MIVEADFSDCDWSVLMFKLNIFSRLVKFIGVDTVTPEELGGILSCKFGGLERVLMVGTDANQLFNLFFGAGEKNLGLRFRRIKIQVMEMTV